jgi:acetyl esterase
MTLDAQAQGLLAMMEAEGMKPFDEMTVPEAREAGIGFIALQGEPEEVADVQNREIPGPAGPIPVRVYTPAGPGPHPVVMYFHGGGWVIGDIEVADKPCRTLANVARATVVSVGYRKAPEHNYPAAPEDCYAATQWVAANAADLGVDGSRIAVAGDSAGGNLAAVVAQMASERGGPALVHQLLIYPAVDAGGEYASRVENGEGYLLTKGAMDWFYAHYLADPGQIEEPYASPIRGSLAGLPPATVITAGYDPLRDEGAAYAKALSDAGVAVRSDENPTLIHGFFWMLGVIDETRPAYDRAGADLRAAFGT